MSDETRKKEKKSKCFVMSSRHYIRQSEYGGKRCSNRHVGIWIWLKIQWFAHQQTTNEIKEKWIQKFKFSQGQKGEKVESEMYVTIPEHLFNVNWKFILDNVFAWMFSSCFFCGENTLETFLNNSNNILRQQANKFAFIFLLQIKDAKLFVSFSFITFFLDRVHIFSNNDQSKANFFLSSFHVFLTFSSLLLSRHFTHMSPFERISVKIAVCAFWCCKILIETHVHNFWFNSYHH